MKTMKRFILLLFLSLSLVSCQKNFKLIISNGIMNETWIYCDSFQMISEKEADVVIDGKTIRIKASHGIYPESSGFFGW
jgi:hypothetical protein